MWVVVVLLLVAMIVSVVVGIVGVVLVVIFILVDFMVVAAVMIMAMHFLSANSICNYMFLCAIDSANVMEI